ncbi:MAG: nucleotide exchange factor GrpE [Chlorobiota bacterium]
MEKKKPLRGSSDKLKDLYNTYVKNDEREIDIKTEEDEMTEENEVLNEEETELESEQETESNDDSDELEFKVDELENQVSNLKDQLLRKTAEMENLRRRTQKEKDELVKYANEKLILNLLDLPDDLSNALEAAKNDSSSKESVIEGVELIYNKAFRLFENAGVKRMDDLVGNEFDVDYHEALMQQPSDEVPEGHIIAVVQPGYLLGEKVIRHAKVVTSSGNPE